MDLARSDLNFILTNIKISEGATGPDLGAPLLDAIGGDPHLPFGLRTVDGSYNNLIPGQEHYGTADQVMPRALTPIFRNDGDGDSIAFGPGMTLTNTDYNQPTDVVDADPRIISNLIADQSLANPAAVAAALAYAGSENIATAVKEIQDAYYAAKKAPPDKQQELSEALTNVLVKHDITVENDTVVIPNVTTDAGLSAPYNSWFTLFGQFFDHGLDLINKGGNGTVYIPLQPDDPLYVPGSHTNFMVVTRATNQAGLDGKLGTSDDVQEHVNQTTPFIDQNQTYTSHASHQVFLREYVLVGNPPHPVATGKMLEGADGGPATWADVKAQARNLLGIELGDHDVLDVPLLATDEYGRFIPGEHGYPQVIYKDAEGHAYQIEGNRGTPIRTGGFVTDPGDNSEIPVAAVRTGHPFLADIAHEAVPVMTGGVLQKDSDDHVGYTTDGSNTTKEVQTFSIASNILKAGEAYTLTVGDVSITVTLEPRADGQPLTAADLATAIVERGPVYDDAPFTVTGVASKLILSWEQNGNIVTLAHLSGGSTSPIDRDASIQGPINARGSQTQYDNELLDAHFIVGDGRGNENIGLTAVHFIFHAEHNRLIEQIKEKVTSELGRDDAFVQEWLVPGAVISDGIQPSEWNGERLFQAARFATEMQYQHLVFEEFARKVQPTIDIFADYNTALNPAIVAEFAHVVYRFGHSMLNETVDRVGSDGRHSDMDLLDAFLDPLAYAGSGATSAEAAAAIIRGMTQQAGNEIDEFVTEALRNDLVGLPLDLAAINIARGRETGVPSLNAARREFFEGTDDPALKPYESWAEFGRNLKHPESLINFIAAYGTHESITSVTTVAEKRAAALLLVIGGEGAPADRLNFLEGTGEYKSGSDGIPLTGLEEVDFWIGGLAELQMPFGGLLGSTFNFVFETQLEALQEGDRFYYLHRLAGTNMLTQLEEGSFAELVMRNTSIKHLPHDVFSTPDFIIEAGDMQAGVPAAMRHLLTKTADGTLLFTSDQHIVMGGTGANDKLTAGAGDDTLWGDGGNDVLEGGTGNDALIGGGGDDRLTDAFGDDVLKGGDGNDWINGGAGIDLVLGGAGHDYMSGGSEDDELMGGLGNDILLGNTGADALIGGEGDDWLEGGLGADGLSGDSEFGFGPSPILGHDVLVGGGGPDAMDGENGDDIFVGGEGADRHFGREGFDWMTYQGDISANGDLNRRADVVPAPGNAESSLDRFLEVEGLSGSNRDDLLSGSDVALEPAEPADPVGPVTPFDPGVPQAAVLTEEGMGRISGLRNLLAPVLSEQVIFTGGDIILGGRGSDVIEGRGGDDFIDGDHALHVSLTSRGPGGTILREITNDSVDGDIDVAVYSGIRADYTITSELSSSGEQAYRIIDNRGIDTTTIGDFVQNIEVFRFLGGDAPDDVALPDIFNRNPAGPETGVLLPTSAVNQSVTFDIADLLEGWSDPDGHTLSILFPSVDPEFGELIQDDDRFTFVPATGFAGPVTITYSVSDGNTSVETQAKVHIGNIPVATFTPVLQEVDEGSSSSVVGTLQASDVDNDPLTFALEDMVGGVFVRDLTTGEISFTPYQDFDGTASVTYVVSDGVLTDEGTITVVINRSNDAPVAVPDTISGEANAKLTIDVLANDTDVDTGDTRTLFSVSVPKGSVSIEDGQVVFDPGTDFDDLKAGATETVTIDYTIKDAQGASSSSTVTVTVTGVNDAAVAEDGTASGKEEDLEIKGQVLATDVDGDPLTYSLVQGPPLEQGTLILKDDGSYSFVPAKDYNGEVTFTYKASDGTMDSNVATVTITVEAQNDAAVAEDGTASGKEDDLEIKGQVVATDVDGDPLTYSLVQGPPLEQGTLILKDDGSYSFVPAKDYNGEVTFTYKASDGTMDSNVATVTITVEAQNDAAVAEDGTASGKEDDLEIKGQVVATDVDGDPLTYSLVQGPPLEQGTLILKDDGSYSFVPAKDYNGEVSFQYVANDGTVDSAPQTVVITVEAQNDAATGRVAMTCMPGTLTASHTLADVDGMSRASVSIQWQSSLDGTTWSDIAGALSPTFAPTAAQEGLQVRALALYTDQGGTEEKVASTQVARIGSAAGGPLNGTEANDILFGLSGDDAIESAGGHDVIEAGGGADTVGGGGGRDTFLASVDDGNDIYDGGRGRDVYSLAGTSARATVDLGAGTATSLQTGSDSLVGIESVIGSRGRDLFMAGAGAHELTGGRGGDVFRFGSAQAAQGDVILDFQAGRDCLHLRGIDADTGTRGNQAFTLLEVGAAFTEAGQLRYSYETDGTVAYTLIQGNVDGDVGVDFEIRLAGHKVFTTGDIVL